MDNSLQEIAGSFTFLGMICYACFTEAPVSAQIIDQQIVLFCTPCLFFGLDLQKAEVPYSLQNPLLVANQLSLFIPIGGQMDLAKFQPARLIPVTGIKGEQDQERRATSALLAVLSAVPDFSRSLLKPLGAPAGKVRTFIEPEFEIEGKKIRPDGLIVVDRANKAWSALVEVKTAKNPLQKEQLHAYLDIARANKIDYLITISNEILTLSGQHPTQGLDARKTRSVGLEHWSWARIIKDAIVEHEHKGVKDSDQAWVLSELVRFLQHDASGANDFEDMGPDWVGVREAVSNGTISSNDPRLLGVVQNFESLTRFVAFRLSARLGVQVSEVIPKIAREDPKKHYSSQVTDFVSTRQLRGGIRIPGAAADMEVIADLRSSQVTCEFEISAPKEGRNATRVNWILRQLPKSLNGARVEVWLKNGRSVALAETLNAAQEKPSKLVPVEPQKEIVSFKVAHIAKLGSKRSSGAGSFIGSVVDLVDETYEHLLQPMKPWQSRAPKLSPTVVDLIPEGDEFNER